jgi:putative transposase
MSYSVETRERVIQFIKEGGTKTEAARLFKLSRQTIHNWTQKLESRGTLEDPPPRRPWKKIDPHKLKAIIKEKPDSTQNELAQHFNVHPTAITYALSRLKITRKKRPHSIAKEMKPHV